MKYIVVLGDGMADYPVPELGNKTPLEAAHKPNIDALAQQGIVGMVRTVPEGVAPASDTANLSVLGYDPVKCYSGRSPLEAASMGIPLSEDDVTWRCNFVTLSETERIADATMVDYSADEISTPEAAQLIAFLKDELNLGANMELFAGISYRHCLVLHHAQPGSSLTPPHDILGKNVGDYLPQGQHGERLLALMEQSRKLLSQHPINVKRVEKGLRPANCCWFWGEGTKPALPSFERRFGLKGGVISAVDLIKGIGILSGMTSVDVEGATGNIHTNFIGKAEAALQLLQEGCDFVYVHIEAPDECGHRQEIENKVKAIELIDEHVVGTLLRRLREWGQPFGMMVLPDHPTPLRLRTHTSDPVPFLCYYSEGEPSYTAACYSENCAKETGLFVPVGHELMGQFIRRAF